jgi:hypothetical protein
VKEEKDGVIWLEFHVSRFKKEVEEGKALAGAITIKKDQAEWFNHRLLEIDIYKMKNIGKGRK